MTSKYRDLKYKFSKRKNFKKAKSRVSLESKDYDSKVLGLHNKQSMEELEVYYKLMSKEKAYLSQRYKSYLITDKQYFDLARLQKYVCAICFKPETVLSKKTLSPKALAVDHCHKTGKVRGLLCIRCNSALGLFKEDKCNLENAIKYLTLNIQS